MSPDNFVRWAAVTEGDAEGEASRGLQRLHGVGTTGGSSPASKLPTLGSLELAP